VPTVMTFEINPDADFVASAGGAVRSAGGVNGDTCAANPTADAARRNPATTSRVNIYQLSRRR
jgi:hypothetical protein